MSAAKNSRQPPGKKAGSSKTEREKDRLEKKDGVGWRKAARTLFEMLIRFEKRRLERETSSERDRNQLGNRSVDPHQKGSKGGKSL